MAKKYIFNQDNTDFLLYKLRMNQKEILYEFLSPIGWLQIVENNQNLTGLRFVSTNRHSLFKTPLIIEVENQLKAFFERKLKFFQLPIKLNGTDFQLKVWNELQNIPFGKTLTYKELSIKLNALKSIRAVGTANGANPIPIIIPCHRVIGSDGTLTGYSGGLKIKRQLLELERPITQTKLFGL